jgi:hypothetical protein
MKLSTRLCFLPGILPCYPQAPKSDAGADHFKIPATDDGLPGQGPIRRYDWFLKLWEQRRSEWAKRIDQDRGALVFLGDSITQGWGDDIGGDFSGTKVANRGISGDTTRGVLIRPRQDVLAFNPKEWCCFPLLEDLENKPIRSHRGQSRLILRELKEFNPQIPIVLCQSFKFGDEGAAGKSKVERLYAETVKDGR